MRITVIIPTFNRAHIIKKSVMSVINQTLPPDEIIIVDDNSTDNTHEIIKGLGSEVKYIKNERQKGANGARNTGINYATSELLAFQDSDDIWYPKKLEEQYKSIVKENSGLCFCSFETNRKNKKKIIPQKEVESKEVFNKILRENFISTQTILVKKNLAQKILFDENLSRFQDWDFVIRFLKEGYKVNHLSKPMVYVEQKDDSISLTTDIIECYNEIFEKHPILLTSVHRNKLVINKVKYFSKKRTEKFNLGMYVQLQKYLFYKFYYKLFKRNI